MHKHRTVQFVAILIFIAAVAYLVLGLIGASQIGRLGLGAGWSSGWRGWLTIPVLIGTLFGFATLMVFGAVLFFLSKIDTNLSLAKQRAAEAKKTVVHVEAPAVEIKAPEVALPRVEVETPKIEAALPEITSPGVYVEAPEMEVSHVTLPEAGAATLAAGAVLYEVLPPEIEAVAPEVEVPAVEVEAPEVTLPTVDLAAPTIEAGLPEVTAPAAHVEAPEENIPSEPAAAQAGVGMGGRLPGSEEIARIAAEMAAIKPVADVPQPSAVQPEPTPLARSDNVLLINGIGVLYTERLQEAGITTYKALAEASDEYLAQVTGATVERIRREEWRVQARLFGNLD